MKFRPLIAPCRAAAFCAGLSLLFAATSAHAVVLTENFNLGAASQSSTIWTDLSNANATLAPDSGSAPGTLSVAGAFQASFGVYSFSQDYTTIISQGASYDIQNVVLQLELSPNPDFTFPFGAGPLLSINGGAYVVTPGIYQSGQSEARNTFGATPLNYIDAVWQWDLSGILDTITSVSILTPVSIHTSTVGARIDTASGFNGYVTPVPEPSALLLSCAGLALAARRRR